MDLARPRLHERVTGKAVRLDRKRDDPLSWLDCLDGSKGNNSTASEKAIASPHNDEVRMVAMGFVANVIEDAEETTLAREHLIALRSGEKATENCRPGVRIFLYTESGPHLAILP
jgi:hypothetical protein